LLLVLLGIMPFRINSVQCQVANPCPELTNGPAFQPGDTVYLDIGPFSDQVKQQIKNALAKWDFANTNKNNSGVRFNTTVNPWALPGYPSLIHVAHKVFFNEDGSVDHQSVAVMETVRTEGILFTGSDNLL
jgi:hypothetical protein